MNFGQSITVCMGKYATFSGRASRSEYWWFFLFTTLMNWGAAIVGAASYNFGEPTGEYLYFEAEYFELMVGMIFLLPTLAAGCRRLHDIGKSGWWQLLILTGIGMIPLAIWWATDTKPAGDRFGDR